MTFSLYSVFHLNLAYSAIRADQRATVVNRCYWPLLESIELENWPCGIEFSGWTLEQLADLDPLWVQRARELGAMGLVEFVGSGYSQIIGPLVPARVNQENLRLGWAVYEEILGVSPALALIPEQAYSAGYAALLANFGLNGFVMEWNNPRATHPEWSPDLLFQPQRVSTASGAQLPVLWNHSVTFQKFQRYAHGELLAEEMVEWLVRQQEKGPNGAFSLYGNDAEVFDFRPGRYMSEEPIQEDGEWGRIRQLIEHLHKDERFDFVLPSKALAHNLSDKQPLLTLESPEQPIPVKKQLKYNIVRWAVTGRDDFSVNSKCHQIASALIRDPLANDDDWKQLLYLWSSDFRTHITDERWSRFQGLLGDVYSLWVRPNAKVEATTKPSETSAGRKASPSFQVSRDSRFLVVESERIRCVLNLRRGLAIQSWVDREISTESLFGTLPIGTFESISLSADWYSGNLTFHPPGFPQATDLVVVAPDISQAHASIFLSAVIDTPLGAIKKTLTINPAEGFVNIRYHTDFSAPPGSLRFGHVAIRVDDEKAHPPRYRTHLGGKQMEEFCLENLDFDHGRAVSNLISAGQGLGSTEGSIDLLVGQTGVRATLDSGSRGAIGMVSIRRDLSGSLLRLFFSASEVDDTTKSYTKGNLEFGVSFGGVTG